MDKIYFFKTSMQNRGRGKGDENTLRALPGQFLPDGSPVDITLNVSSPKEAGSSIHGSRLEYPVGTVFGSSHLELNTTKKKPFYTVYPGGTINEQVEFYPVSSDPYFAYADPLHKNEEMNAAYTLYEAGMYLTNTPTASENQVTSTIKQIMVPYTKEKKAKGTIEGWTPRYPEQTEEELNFFVNWMRNLFSSEGVSPKKRIGGNSIKNAFSSLYEMGETLDSLVSRERFKNVLIKENLDFSSFKLYAEGPHEVYINHLFNEHILGKDSSYVERNLDDMDEVEDLMTVLRDAHRAITGSLAMLGGSDIERDNIVEAIKAGWEVQDLLDPEYLNANTAFDQWTQDIASGKIIMPVRKKVETISFIEKLMKEEKNKPPQISDGFYIDGLTWKLLVNNLFSRGKERPNTLLVGPTGSGKTEIVKRLCQQTKTDLTIIQMGTITDPSEQLIGKMDLDENGHTYFDWAEFALAVQKPGVVLLDEINRIPRNGDNSLFSCLDGTRELVASGAKGTDERRIQVHPDCVFIATANIGDEYTGTKDIDEALSTRLMPIELEYMPKEVESKILVNRTGIEPEQANIIANVAEKIRLKAKAEQMRSISTRETLRCSTLVKNGFSLIEAMEAIFLPLYDKGAGDFDASSERSQIKLILQQNIVTC